MKIIHCAELHLDSQMTANLTKEQARERKREIIRTFTRKVEYAEKLVVRLIMIFPLFHPKLRYAPYEDLIPITTLYSPF